MVQVVLSASPAMKIIHLSYTYQNKALHSMYYVKVVQTHADHYMYVVGKWQMPLCFTITMAYATFPFSGLRKLVNVAIFLSATVVISPFDIWDTRRIYCNGICWNTFRFGGFIGLWLQTNVVIFTEVSQQNWSSLLVFGLHNNLIAVSFMACNHSNCFFEGIGQSNKDNMITPCAIITHVCQIGIQVIIRNEWRDVFIGNLKDSATSNRDF